MSREPFPFSAVVGQEDAQQALLLAAIDPAIGGVLLRGEKGSAKSTLARGLASLLPDDAPFVELPVGATEDRVLGSLDLRSLVDSAGAGSPEQAFRPGLLAAAHGGVLYVDEVNLLPDQIVDGLLDAAASGTNRVERDGVSHEHPARFVLLGSMNPEEGELRPQLLDRFGLAVEVRSPQDPAVRAEAVRRRLVHDARSALTNEVDAELRERSHHRSSTPDTDWADAELRGQLASSRPARLPDQVVTFAATLAVSVGAESLRADLVLCRAAAAFAGWEGREAATEDDVARVAPFALGHRRRRRPFDPPTLPPDELESALETTRKAVGDRDEDDVGKPLSGHQDLRDPVGSEPSAGTRNGGDHSTVSPNGGRESDDTGASAADEQRSRIEDDNSNSPNGQPPATADGTGGEVHDGAGDQRPPGGEDTSAGHAGGAGQGQSNRLGSRWDELAGDGLEAAPTPLDLLGGRSRPRPRPKVTDDGGSGRVADHGIPGPDGPRGVAVLPTVRAMAARRAAVPDGPAIHPDDVREPRRLHQERRTVVLAVDTSGSMGTAARVDAATGAVLGLLADAYLARDHVALVAFRGEGAQEVLPPTASVELARARLADLPTGGSTPLAEGIAAGLASAQRAAAKDSTPLLVVLTDGRATGDPDALDRARSAARAVADAGIETLVLDAEDGHGTVRLGLAAELADLMQGRCVPLASITSSEVESAIRRILS